MNNPVHLHLSQGIPIRHHEKAADSTLNARQPGKPVQIRPRGLDGFLSLSEPIQRITRVRRTTGKPTDRSPRYRALVFPQNLDLEVHVGIDPDDCLAGRLKGHNPSHRLPAPFDAIEGVIAFRNTADRARAGNYDLSNLPISGIRQPPDRPQGWGLRKKIEEGKAPRQVIFRRPLFRIRKKVRSRTPPSLRKMDGNALGATARRQGFRSVTNPSSFVFCVQEEHKASQNQGGQEDRNPCFPSHGDS